MSVASAVPGNSGPLAERRGVETGALIASSTYILILNLIDSNWNTWLAAPVFRVVAGSFCWLSALSSAGWSFKFISRSACDINVDILNAIRPSSALLSGGVLWSLSSPFCDIFENDLRHPNKNVPKLNNLECLRKKVWLKSLLIWIHLLSRIQLKWFVLEYFFSVTALLDPWNVFDDLPESRYSTDFYFSLPITHVDLSLSISHSLVPGPDCSISI